MTGSESHENFFVSKREDGMIKSYPSSRLEVKDYPPFFFLKFNWQLEDKKTRWSPCFSHKAKRSTSVMDRILNGLCVLQGQPYCPLFHKIQYFLFLQTKAGPVTLTIARGDYS